MPRFLLGHASSRGWDSIWVTGSCSDTVGACFVASTHMGGSIQVWNSDDCSRGGSRRRSSAGIHEEGDNHLAHFLSNLVGKLECQSSPSSVDGLARFAATCNSRFRYGPPAAGMFCEAHCKSVCAHDDPCLHRTNRTVFYVWLLWHITEDLNFVLHMES